MGQACRGEACKRAMGISIDRVVDGRIVENRLSRDMVGMLQRLGVVGLPG